MLQFVGVVTMLFAGRDHAKTSAKAKNHELLIV